MFDDSFEVMAPAGPQIAVRRGSLPPLQEGRSRGRGLCEPGVLQLVPRINRHIPSNVERTRGRAGAEKRTDVRNHGVQTISAAQAVFAADRR